VSLSLHTIAQGLGGRVQGNKVLAPGPEAASQKVKWKRKRKTLAVWVGNDGDIRVHSHAGQDPIITKDWVGGVGFGRRPFALVDAALVSTA
jgi:hypothetical protein